ncbi:hypothetical protein B586_19840 [Mycobacterium haemophilum DSM 44634]|uniref:Uncharacterized protein n=1 Tax=Mycobacterium haemophilum TaxID=29311 RepID=A0A0I9TUN2_9MYCO|nr:hypothetical protein B586_19840 [Mycobacterium haemophilum DSM 44634]KLO32235.1 hypothetical protein ABH39_07845 [Mycobacterium haemophilum]KLO36642.1 hypothetical protein ABH38_11760 [Mycobacterium haemophilum]KLO42570.1 hypothetical protein ABH37_10390 [Mycobacterium haemophilum]KLO55446.1 hypothetical protein ABH36_07365 [Mycobacterium haemophilum]
MVPSGERLLDHLQSMVHSGLELENDAAIADGFRFENYVPFTVAIDIGDRVTRVQCFDGHQLWGSV